MLIFIVSSDVYSISRFDCLHISSVAGQFCEIIASKTRTNHKIADCSFCRCIGVQSLSSLRKLSETSYKRKGVCFISVNVYQSAFGCRSCVTSESAPRCAVSGCGCIRYYARVVRFC